MKTGIETRFLLPALIAVLNLIPAGRVTAQTFTTLHSFTAFPYITNLDGADPTGFVVSDNTLYGTAIYGGSSEQGTVFKVNTDGTGFTTLHSFSAAPNSTNSDGTRPRGGLILSGNTLYGTAGSGGSSGGGTVFKVNTDGTAFTNLHNFTGVNYDSVTGVYTNRDGAEPRGGLILTNNTLYGPAPSGGSSGDGTVFAVNTDGTGFTILHSFLAMDYSSFPYTNSDGAGPTAGLIISGNTLYGTAPGGGPWGSGTVFKVNMNGTGFTTLHSFTGGSDGGSPYDAALTLSGNTLYGTTTSGGSSGNGTVFKVSTGGAGFTTLHSFTATSGFYPPTNSDGANPYAGLFIAGNTLYGTTIYGGSSGNGTVFAVKTNGTGFSTLHNFTGGSDGAAPFAGVFSSSNTLYGTAGQGGASGQGTIFKVNTNGTGFTTLHSFTPLGQTYNTNSDGSGPWAGLITNSSGTTLYGTAINGGSAGNGTVFAVNADGAGFTTLHSFTAAPYPYWTNSDGGVPFAGLLLSGNTLYGTASSGGNSGAGAVFALNTDGSGFTNLHSFAAASYSDPDTGDTNSDGISSWSGLILSGNTLYGTAKNGGLWGRGTVFAVNTDGTGFTNLHNFAAWRNDTPGNYTNSDGALPLARLTISGNTLYGTAFQGGIWGRGTVFAVNTDGSGFTNLHNFEGDSDGSFPCSGLVLSGNTLYGTKLQSQGPVFAVNTDGTGFTNLHIYTNGDGYSLQAGLFLSGNTLYGTAEYGGGSGNGTMFALNTDGTGFTNLHSFAAASCFGCPNSEGARPMAGLILAGNTLYGTASSGGSSGNGTVFGLSFRPQLTIVPSGTNVILTWPAIVAGFDYTGYTLQSTTNLVSPAVWSTNSPAPVVIAGQNTVTNPITGAQKFYRLMQ